MKYARHTIGWNINVSVCGERCWRNDDDTPEKKGLTNAAPNRPSAIIYNTASHRLRRSDSNINDNEIRIFVVVINLQLFRSVCLRIPVPVSVPVALSCNCRFVRNCCLAEANMGESNKWMYANVCEWLLKRMKQKEPKSLNNGRGIAVFFRALVWEMQNW